MEYLPGMRKLAGKYRRDREQRDDLVTDTIAKCLETWENYREDGGFWNWIYWAMRGVMSKERDARKRKLRIVDDPEGHWAATIGMAPTQLKHVELSQTLDEMKGREGDILMRRAMGERLCEIGATLGVCKERVRQIEKRERQRLIAHAVAA
jgi:RNA polymerase sigma factor (sigma-70 family)